MNATRRLLTQLLADERGGTAIEYGMIAALIVVGILVGVNSLADANSANYQLIEDEITA